MALQQGIETQALAAWRADPELAREFLARYTCGGVARALALAERLRR
jgi:hypothetical protein